MDEAALVGARFVERENRFVVRARLGTGETVRAHFPNTGRMVGMLDSDTSLLLQRATDPARRTPFSVLRLLDGETLVAVAASEASRMVEERLQVRPRLPPLGLVRGWQREVALEGRRVDLRLDLDGGEHAWLEVKSLSLASRGDALFSRTPSTRGRAHLELLGDLAERGEKAACAFVVQRGDVRRLVADPDADPGWLASIVRARRRGVRLLAFRCAVTAWEARIERPIPVDLGERG